MKLEDVNEIITTHNPSRRDTRWAKWLASLLAYTTMVLLLTGCSTPMVWYKPGVPVSQIQTDLAQAKLQSTMLPSGFIPNQGTTVNVNTGTESAAQANYAAANNVGNNNMEIASLLIANQNKKEFIKDSMEAKGYMLIKKSELPPGAQGVSN
jgi:hypothetical protein